MSYYTMTLYIPDVRDGKINSPYEEVLEMIKDVIGYSSNTIHQFSQMPDSLIYIIVEYLSSWVLHDTIRYPAHTIHENNVIIVSPDINKIIMKHKSSGSIDINNSTKIIELKRAYELHIPISMMKFTAKNIRLCIEKLSVLWINNNNEYRIIYGVKKCVLYITIIT